MLPVHETEVIPGELGDGTDINRYSPVKISGLSSVIEMAAAHAYSMALTDDRGI
jgi:hypothetical protein